MQESANWASVEIKLFPQPRRLLPLLIPVLPLGRRALVAPLLVLATAEVVVVAVVIPARAAGGGGAVGAGAIGGSSATGGAGTDIAAAFSMNLSSSPRSSQTPRHFGQ